ncbi:hypothetical protein, partial [Pseudomonas juntendi]
QTTEDQFELAKGSFWEQHGLLVAGAPEQPADADADRQALIDENEQLKKDVFAYQEQLKDLASKIKDGPQQVKDLQDKLIQEQARSSKLETELKEAQAKLAGKK